MNRVKNIMEGTWSLAHGWSDDAFFILRFVSNLTKASVLPDLPWLALIYWDFIAEENGAPLPYEAEQMDEFEERLITALAKDESGVLLGVSTQETSRMFIAYVRDAQTLNSNLNEITDDKQNPFPIEIEMDEDSGWEYFFDFIALDKDEEEGQPKST